jgi:nucleoside-diphosphate-sugar epimerase
MRALVLGANGFLGSHLQAYLSERGSDVRIISYRPDKQQEFLDSLRDLLEKFSPDVVYNAGASQDGGDDPTALNELISSNILLPSMLAWAIKRRLPTSALVCFGSSWQYDENGASNPFNAYAASKSASECMLDHYYQDGVRIASLRLYDTYGPQDPRRKIVNLIADALIKKQPLDMSPGDQAVDLVHINDVLSAIDRVTEILRNERHGCHYRYSVRSGTTVTIKELVRIMMEISGLHEASFIRLGVRDYRKRERFIQYSAPTPPGWSAKIALGEGLTELMSNRTRLSSGSVGNVTTLKDRVGK